MAPQLALKPACRVHGSCSSSFRGLTSSLQRLSLAVPATRPQSLTVEAKGKHCQLTGKVANNGYVVTFSHKRNKKLQEVNLQQRKVYWPEEQRWVKLRISTRAIKTIEKKGLQVMAKEAGLDLYKLPYVDAGKARREWLAANPMRVPMAKNSRAMKNPDKIAASTKKPLTAEYMPGGRIRYFHPSE